MDGDDSPPPPPLPIFKLGSQDLVQDEVLVADVVIKKAEYAIAMISSKC